MANLKYTQEILAKAVSESLTMREALRKCGVPNLSGGTYHYVTKRIKAYGIDTSHFVGQRWNLGKHFPATRKSITEILVYHSDGCRQRSKYLMRALLETGREYKCFECGLREWRKKRIVLEIEHKDADFQNDKEDNLEFICPNCHSQTNTFCRGKEKPPKPENLKKERRGRKRKERHPSKDGYWRTRDKVDQRKVVRPEPCELLSLMQKMPMVKIGKMYGVSDNAVRKWAKRYGIDIPKRGPLVESQTHCT